MTKPRPIGGGFVPDNRHPFRSPERSGVRVWLLGTGVRCFDEVARTNDGQILPQENAGRK